MSLEFILQIHVDIEFKFLIENLWRFLISAERFSISVAKKHTLIHMCSYMAYLRLLAYAKIKYSHAAACT